METCIYRVIYTYHSHLSFAFNDSRAVVYVEARKDIWRDELERLCCQKFDRFWRLNSFEKIYVTKLA